VPMFFKRIPKSEHSQRVLVLVGNDLVGDSRVQKIIKSSIQSNFETFVLARVSPDNKPPQGLEEVKIVRIPFHSNSPMQMYGFGSFKGGAIGGLQNLYNQWRVFLNFLRRRKAALKYFLIVRYSRTKSSLRRNKRRVKRFFFQIAISEKMPWPLNLVRDKAFAFRDDKRELKRREKELEYSNHLATGGHNTSLSGSNQQPTLRPIPEVKHTDFSEYLERMHSWFIYPAIKAKPDIIHANDADTLSIAIETKEYWASKGHKVAVVYDSHEFTAGVYRANPTWLPAMESLEYKYIPKVDAVVTVSEAIAKLMKERFSLDQLPEVVVNAPSFQSEEVSLTFPSLRESLNLDASVPLFVYVGVSAELRGIHTAIEALRYFPEAHLAIVTKNNYYLGTCRELAKEIGVTNRVHIKPYVAQHLVSAYISDASAGISPILHHPNHELSCFTKFYEFLHSRLPIVTSDVQVMKETTLNLGVGTSYIAGDPIDCANQMKELITNLGKYQSAITDELLNELSWESQESKLHALYQEAYDLVTTDSR
jgi:glycosyltransferase involved in cell wall biosynthesis